MSIPPYLVNYIKTADDLPALLPDASTEVIDHLQDRIRSLVVMVVARDRQIDTLNAQLEQKVSA